MLKLIQIGSSLPMSYITDPDSSFQPGMIGQLVARGNQITLSVSDGTSPKGVIDDIKTKAFSAAAVDEVLIIPSVGISQNGQIVSPIDIKMELANPNVAPKSFMASIPVQLIPRNGVIVIPAGTPLNFDLTGTGSPNAIRVVVNYSYQIPNVPGDNSTNASGRTTCWITRIVAATDQFETNQRYPLNCNLFVSESGLLTSRQPSPRSPSVAVTDSPPTSILSGFLEFTWL